MGVMLMREAAAVVAARQSVRQVAAHPPCRRRDHTIVFPIRSPTMQRWFVITSMEIG